MEEPSSHVKNFLSNSFDNVSLNSIIKDVEDIPQIQRGHTNFLELSKDLKVLSRSGRLLPLKTAAERQAANAMSMCTVPCAPPTLEADNSRSRCIRSRSS